MKEYVIQTIERIKNICEEYLDRKINLITLQTTLSAMYFNFENDIPKGIHKEVSDCIYDIDYIQAMYNKDEQDEAIKRKILDLLSKLKVFNKN